MIVTVITCGAVALLLLFLDYLAYLLADPVIRGSSPDHVLPCGGFIALWRTHRVVATKEVEMTKVTAGFNLEARREFAARLIGKKMEVVAAGTIKPHADPSISLYLPLPEYGIALVIRQEGEVLRAGFEATARSAFRLTGKPTIPDDAPFRMLYAAPDRSRLLGHFDFAGETRPHGVLAFYVDGDVGEVTGHPRPAPADESMNLGRSPTDIDLVSATAFDRVRLDGARVMRLIINDAASVSVQVEYELAWRTIDRARLTMLPRDEAGLDVPAVDPRDLLIADLCDMLRHADGVDDRNGAMARAEAHLRPLIG